MKTKNLLVASLAAVGLLTARPASAQLTLTGTNYFQNFDNITANGGLPSEWSVREGSVNTTSLGNLSAFPATPGTSSWSSSTGAFYNLAGATNNGTNFLGTESAAVQEAAPNRCPAVRVSAAFGDTNSTGGVGFCMQMANTTGFGNFNLDMDFLLLSVQGRSNIWTVEYGFGSSPSSFISVGSYTALNTPTGVFGATHKSFSFGSALDNQPGPVWIRIACDTLITGGLNSGGSGSRPTFGIDNFNLGWTTVSSATQPVVINGQPQSATNNAGDTAIFTVAATGTSPTYQWSSVVGSTTNALNNGANADGSMIAGANSPSLQISGVLGAEAGTYVVNISNTLNSTNSALVTLAVNDPYISAQPASQTNAPGDIDYFDATAVGSSTMDIKWVYNGTVIQETTPGGNTNTVFVYVTNSPTWTNLGGFYMIASNQFGTATSSVVTASLPSLPPALITRWDFNETTTYTASNPAASIGLGTGSNVTGGGFYTNFLFASGSLNDANNLTPGVLNEGWEYQDGPTNGTANKQVGFQYNTSTVGYNHIVLTWSERHSATASKYMRVQYSSDGLNFFDGPVITLSEVAYDFSMASLAGFPVVNNNPNFAFRIVQEFESTAIGSTNANYDGVTSTYGPGTSGGTIRNDIMTVWGSPILNITTGGGNAVLTWPAGFNLQSATNVTGTYTNVTGAVSGYSTPLGKQMFFRLH